jgi:uncharacterized protein YbjT (DUF2867 family)
LASGITARLGVGGRSKSIRVDVVGVVDVAERAVLQPGKAVADHVVDGDDASEFGFDEAGEGVEVGPIRRGWPC